MDQPLSQRRFVLSIYPGFAEKGRAAAGGCCVPVSWSAQRAGEAQATGAGCGLPALQQSSSRLVCQQQIGTALLQGHLYLF